MTATEPYGHEKSLKALWGFGVDRAETDQAARWLAIGLLGEKEGFYCLSHHGDLFVLVAHLNGTEGEGIVDALQEKLRAGFRVTSRKQYVRIMIGPRTCYPHAFSTAINDRDI